MLTLILRTCRSVMTGSPGATAWLLVLSVGLVQAANAQSENDPPAEPIEEITSYGSRSLLSFRIEMVQAEAKYYDLFNDLNDDDEFDVICKSATGNSAKSRITQRVCKGRFEWESFSENDRDRFAMGFVPFSNGADIMRKKGIVLDKMENLANENPEFRESLIELTRISQRFEAEKKKRCAGRIICAGPGELADQ